MKSLAFAAALCALLVSPVVQAGSSQGDGARLPIGVEGTYKSETDSNYNPYGTVQLAADDLRSQFKANQAWEHDRDERLVREGYEVGHVCNGPNVPVEVASWCWNGTVGGAKQPNPTPQIGSGHGSD